MNALVTLANWIPDPNPEFGAEPEPFIVLMVLGFFVAILGHLSRTKWLIALGIMMIFLATALLPLLTYWSKS